MIVSKNAIIFGETRLTISCIRYLLDNGWSINAVFTCDRYLISWCKEQDIRCLDVEQGFELTENLGNCHIFSIINSYILSAKLLAHLKPIKAINYHDSLLPKYAGINSTTWAILDNEEFHGITWHEMIAGIDEGDIYYQAKVAIDAADTAFSLNLKCTDAALAGFTKLIRNIEQDKLVGVRQNLAQKTYFGREYVPINYAYLTPTDNESYINNLLNGLSFGDGYINPVSTVKIKINKMSYILEKKEPQENISVLDPSGYILRNMYGKKINRSFNFAQIRPCVLRDTDISNCKKLKKNEFSTYNDLSQLLSESEIQSGLLSYAAMSGDKEELSFDLKMSADKLCLFLSIILSRLNSKDTFIKLYHKNISAKDEITEEITENISILNISLDNLDLHYSKMVQKIADEVDTKRLHLFKDFGYRYNLNLCSEFAITNNYSGAIDDHSVIFVINQDKISVRFYCKDTDFIKMLIKTISILFTEHQNAKKANEQIKKLPLLSTEDYQKVVYGWNAAAKEYLDNKTVHQLFEEQVAKSPNNIAVVYEDVKLTYKELNNQSNQLANYLKATYQIKGDDLIALCLNRSEYMLIAILGVLKSGAAYVPIDPNYPADRIIFVLNDIKSRVLIADSRTYHLFPEICYSSACRNASQDILTIDNNKFIQVLKEYSISNPGSNQTSGNLAYVFYTSGTTGKPKGIMVEHKACITRLLNMVKDNNMNFTDIVLFKTNYIFDVSFSDIFTSFLCGACVVVTNDTFDVSEIYSKLIKYNVTICHFTPSQFLMFKHVLKNNFDALHVLKKVLFSGEAFYHKYLNDIGQRFNFLNFYGPTETGEVSVYKFTYSEYFPRHCSLIGYRFINTFLYVLDNNLSVLPIGAIGELYIGGCGLARGYLNQPKLTDERFIPNPFQNKEEKKSGKNSRLYRTGDLVRYLINGNLEYIGRNDLQIKIRGHRIELSEIENILNIYPEIRTSVVLHKKPSNELLSGNTCLVAYYVSDKELNEVDVLAYLAKTLPEYMIPNILMRVEQLPLTMNGKLDRNALPHPDFTAKNTHVAPRNELEQKCCTIYAEVLKLSVSNIGITDDFFRLGGNSLLAIKLANKLSTELNLNIPVTILLKYKSITAILNQVKSSHVEVAIIPKAMESGDSRYLLSFAQERLWFIDKYENMSNAYNIPLVAEINYKIDLTILKQSISSILARHEILHSLIKTDESGSSYQEICNLTEKPLIFNEQTISSQSKLTVLIHQAVNHIYKLDEEYPIKVAIFRKKTIKSEKHYICIVAHHIAFDGWSVDIFINELQRYYNYYYDRVLGKQSSLNLPELSIQYKDFAIWQRSYISSLLAGQLKYWLKKLAGYQTLNLPLDKCRPQHISYIGDDAYFTLTEITSNKLRMLAKSLNVSLYSVFLSSYYILLSSYSNQDDIVVGTPVANRHYPQLEDLIGFFVNSLALRTKISRSKSLIEYITQVSAQIIEAQLYQDLPFEKLVTELKVPQDTSRHPIFQVMFTMQSFGWNTANNSPLLKPYQIHEYKIARFDITTFMYDSQPTLRGVFNYATKLFNQATILNMIDTFQYILTQIANLDINSDTKIEELSYLSEDKYQNVIYDWNKADKEYSSDKMIHELFEEHVIRTPDNIAITYKNTKLTYCELNKKSNQLANYLRTTYQIKGDDLIALCLERSEHMIIAILAVLKSGAGYVPIDQTYPKERVRYILEDIKTKVILTNKKNQKNLENIISNKSLSNVKFTTMVANSKHWTISNISVIYIDSTESKVRFKQYSSANLKKNITSNKLAYVIYTSGTMGNPKGVLQQHNNVVGLLNATDDFYKFNNQDVWTLFHSYVFDFSVWEIWGALAYGGQLVIPSNEQVKNFSAFYKLCCECGVTILNQTPNVFYQLINITITNNEILKLNSLRYIILGGDILNLIKLKLWFSCYGYNKPKVVNMYGITETTVHVTYQSITMHDIGYNSYIGKRIPDKKIYVLNNNLTPLPIGAIGELYVGGDGLARGYLNQPKLTKDSFIDNPFQTIEENKQSKNSILYKTGDLVHYRPDGSLVYIGRNDFQIKIRGFRIELSEIENVLGGYDGIKQSVVIVEEHLDRRSTPTGNKYIVAYYVANSKLDAQDILRYISNKLPDYMVPNTLIWLKKIPLNINGKLDKLSLPKYQWILQNDYAAPRNIAEFKICTAFADILNLEVDQVGINHDFFKLGGNSILAINLLYRLQQEFKINLNDVFRLKTPAKVANLAPSRKNNMYSKLTQMKSVYDKLASYEISPEMQRKKAEYLKEVKQISFTRQLKNIHNVLLTGATGHLGCHILYQLLYETSYKIYLLIRATSNVEAYNRINNKFKYYFDVCLDNYKDRIIVIAADIEKSDFGISHEQYRELVSNVDSIIHSAALVKHYGNYTSFYNANIQATVNLLELAKQTKLKDFHYISTLSVFINCYISNSHYHIWTEYDEQIDLGNRINNVYVKTKYEGELATIKYREFGVSGNIYRVGNLAMNSKNYRNQENIEENAFFTRIKTILNIGMIPKEIATVEISPVDCTALAITKLFNQVELNDKIYHIANPHTCDLSNLFTQWNNVRVKTVAFEEFIGAILMRLNNRINREQTERFMLHQMWLEEINLEKLTKLIVLQDKTDVILSKLDFSWPEITTKMISSAMGQMSLGDKKMKKKEPIFEYLESIAELIPAPCYWLDLEGRTIGLNTLNMKGVGALNKSDVIGKTAYEIYQNKDIADKLQDDINRVLRTGENSQTEDVIVDVITGKLKYYSATRAPLRNKKNEIIGVVGTSIEITSEKEKLIAQKEAEQLKHENRKLEAQNKINKIILEKEAAESERLRLENALQKLENDKHMAAAEEQDKFKKIVGQVIHDIQSPLASLRGIVEDTAGSIPEEKRITLRQASMRISDIAQNMLSRYKNEADDSELAEPLLVSTALLEVLSEKRFEHKSVTIDTNFKAEAHFAFIQIEPIQFKRMISNIVNNAVQALGNKPDGQVKVELGVNQEWVFVFIEDNGCGMSQELIDKIEKNVSITIGKKHGSGIGLTQVHEALQRNYGQLTVNSVEGEFTEILLKFPRIMSPFWIAEEIKIVKDDTIVILDDDPSIHGAWDSKLRPTLAKIPEIKVRHFSEGVDAINFINSLPHLEKDKICLLADYELLHQGINGLEVIEKTRIKRSTLVTSHYANPEIREDAANLRVKILPKQLAFAVPINLDKKIEPGSKKVDMVWVDDARWFIRDWKQRFANLVIDAYYDPDSFLEDVYQYPLDTKIILDRNYYDREGPGRKFLGDGLIVAKILHEKGYTNLVMVTGEEPDPSIIPSYLKVILKEEDAKIKGLAN